MKLSATLPQSNENSKCVRAYKICCPKKKLPHNIIQIHNNVMWDWQYYVEYSTWNILYNILSLHNYVMDMQVL
jgi:hypothetical protein